MEYFNIQFNLWKIYKKSKFEAKNHLETTSIFKNTLICNHSKYDEEFKKKNLRVCWNNIEFSHPISEIASSNYIIKHYHLT